MRHPVILDTFLERAVDAEEPEVSIQSGCRNCWHTDPSSTPRHVFRYFHTRFHREFCPRLDLQTLSQNSYRPWQITRVPTPYHRSTAW